MLQANKKLGGGNSKIFYVHPEPWGNDPIWRAYFSNGLKPPTRKPHRNLWHPMGPRRWDLLYFFDATRTAPLSDSLPKWVGETPIVTICNHGFVLINFRLKANNNNNNNNNRQAMLNETSRSFDVVFGGGCKKLWVPFLSGGLHQRLFCNGLAVETSRRCLWNYVARSPRCWTRCWF